MWKQIVYLLLGIAGFATALYYGAPYWASDGASLGGFASLAFANGPAATLSSDAAVFYVLASFFIVVEGRRIGMRHLWLYLLTNTFIAVAVGLAAFLFVRERHLRSQVERSR